MWVCAQGREPARTGCSGPRRRANDCWALETPELIAEVDEQRPPDPRGNPCEDSSSSRGGCPRVTQAAVVAQQKGQRAGGVAWDECEWLWVCGRWSQLCLFPLAAGTSHHKLSSLKQVFPYNPGDQKSRPSFWRPRGGIHLLPLPASEVARRPQLTAPFLSHSDPCPLSSASVLSSVLRAPDPSASLL